MGSNNRPISAYRLGEIPIQSCGQSVSAPRGTAGARLNAHTELRAKCERSAREAIYRNRPISGMPYPMAPPPSFSAPPDRTWVSHPPANMSALLVMRWSMHRAICAPYLAAMAPHMNAYLASSVNLDTAH